MSPASYTPDELKSALAGCLIPAVPVMFDRENRFHESAHEAYVSFMSSQPIAGVAVWRIREGDFFLMTPQPGELCTSGEESCATGL